MTRETIYKCDRCHEIIPTWTAKTTLYKSYNHETNWDLCSGCFNAFITFMAVVDPKPLIVDPKRKKWFLKG